MTIDRRVNATIFPDVCQAVCKNTFMLTTHVRLKNEKDGKYYIIKVNYNLKGTPSSFIEYNRIFVKFNRRVYEVLMSNKFEGEGMEDVVDFEGHPVFEEDPIQESELERLFPDSLKTNK